MNTSLIFLVLFTIAFYCTGGVIDYWQSARHHHKPLPDLLKNYFALFWLILYSGILPFLMVYSAGGFNMSIALKYLGALLIGISFWDIIYSLLSSKRPVTGIKDYWFWGNKNYGLTKNQVLIWHLIRISAGAYLILH